MFIRNVSVIQSSEINKMLTNDLVNFENTNRKFNSMNLNIVLKKIRSCLLTVNKIQTLLLWRIL